MKHVAVMHPNGDGAWVCAFPETASEPGIKAHDQMIFDLGEEIESLRQQLAIRDAEVATLNAEKFEAGNNQTIFIVRITELREQVKLLQGGILAVNSLIDNSSGVVGLHKNGNIAEWGSLRTGGQFEPWLIEFDEALAVQSDDTALQQFAAKVREQCEQAAQPEDSYQDDWFNAKTDAVARIRAIKELPK